MSATFREVARNGGARALPSPRACAARGRRAVARGGAARGERRGVRGRTRAPPARPVARAVGRKGTCVERVRARSGVRGGRDADLAAGSGTGEARAGHARGRGSRRDERAGQQRHVRGGRRERLHARPHVRERHAGGAPPKATLAAAPVPEEGTCDAPLATFEQASSSTLSCNSAEPGQSEIH